MNYPKSVLKGRTPAQYEFDMGIKGWAFAHPDTLAHILARAERLFAAIDRPDPDRQAKLDAIRKAATHT